MNQEPLVNEQIEAGEEFVRDFTDHYSVAAAFWINPADSERWYLYVASAEISADNLPDAYGDVVRCVGGNTNQWLDPFQIKLLNSANPLAASVIEIRDLYNLKTPMRYRESNIAGMGIDGAYIYPPIAATSATL